MSLKRKLSRKDIQKRDRLIRYYAKKRYSANLIQHKLREKGLGMRRKELLAKVREVKGVPKKRKAEVHIPIKYRKVKRRRVRVVPAKWVAVYGTVDGESRRVELAGSGRQLYKAMLDLAKHPPKKRFVKCSASEVPYYLDYEDEWDEHPAVRS
jgi:hypothetical protein